jgi:hypothetical protein
MKFDTILMADQMQITPLHPPGCPYLRQDRHLHAEAGLWRQRLGHAMPPVDWKDGKPVFAGNGIPPVGDVPSHIAGVIKHAAINAFWPDHQFLQAPGAGL